MLEIFFFFLVNNPTQLEPSERKIEHLNLANYQKVKLKPHSSNGIPSKRRTHSIQGHGNCKILEKNEGYNDVSMSSYEESINISQNDLTQKVSIFTF